MGSGCKYCGVYILMRTFVSEDKKFGVKIVVNLPEEMYQGIRHAKKDYKEAIKKLAIFTLEKEELQ